MVWAYHPGIDQAVQVEDGAMPQLRRSGWLTKAEHDANQAEIEARAKAEAAQAAAASKAAGKTAAKEN